MWVTHVAHEGYTCVTHGYLAHTGVTPGLHLGSCGLHVGYTALLGGFALLRWHCPGHVLLGVTRGFGFGLHDEGYMLVTRGLHVGYT
jgi:hypothetical protein